MEFIRRFLRASHEGNKLALVLQKVAAPRLTVPVALAIRDGSVHFVVAADFDHSPEHLAAPLIKRMRISNERYDSTQLGIYRRKWLNPDKTSAVQDN